MADPRIRTDPPKDSLLVNGLSDKGNVRSINEDYFDYYIPPEAGLRNKWGSLFVVSDGVGGSAAGEAASTEAVNVLLQEYYLGSHTEELPGRLKNAFRTTSLHIYELSVCHASVRDMKCTLTALLLIQSRYFIMHVGDSKVLLLHDGDIIQLTRDHTLASELLELGVITPKDAQNHPDKNALLKAVGDGPLVMPDFHSGIVKPGDLFCLITDGILEHISAEELKCVLFDKGSTKEALSQLIAELNRRGGYDNMTILTIRVNRVPC